MWEKVIRLGMVGVFVLLVGCESDENEPEVLGGAADTEMKSAPTAPPPTEEPMPSVTAQQLHDEREANATRYDAQYKGNWVRISGQVTKIDGGDVFLGADGFLNDVRLQDLSQEEQIALDKGDTVTATCRVGNYILGSIFLEGCELHPTEMPAVEVRAPATEAEPTAAPQPSPTSAPVVSPPTEEPMPSVTAQQLHDERKANATRYDAQYKGNWVRISGQITKIDGGDVFLGADGFLNDVILQDLSQEEQIALDKGDTVTATCRVGNYILGSIFLEGCELHPTEMPAVEVRAPATEAEPTAAPQPSPTSAPVVSPPTEEPMPSVTAQQLHDERKANATRYDAQYKGNWVRISGQVTKIDGGDVFLGADGFLNDVILQDLSQEEQIALDKGDTVTATCRVGNYILGSIFLEGCELHPTEMPAVEVRAPATEAEPTAAPKVTPEPTATLPVPTPEPIPTQAPPVPSPPSSPVEIGTTVEAGGSSYTLNEVKDPAPAGVFGGVDAGKRLVALDITQVGISDDGDRYNPRYFAVQDTDGYVYDPGFADADVEPSFGSGELAAGQIVRGWVVFELPESARLVSVLAEPEVVGARITIADLAQDQGGNIVSHTPPPVPSPPSSPVEIGTTVEAGGSSYTLNEVKDPAPASVFGGVDAGKRLVALDITQVGISDDGDRYNPRYFAVQDTDGYVYDPGFADADVEPSFGSGELAAGQIVRGWVVFELPESARLVSVLAEPEVVGARITIADLAQDQGGNIVSHTPPPVPSPPSSPVEIGTTVEAGGSSYTLNEVKDPAPAGVFGGVDAGKRLVALDITQVGISDDGDRYNPRYFAVQDTDGYVYDPGFADADVEPSFGSGELAAGQIVRGWVVFELPESARLVSVLAEPEVVGARITIADLGTGHP